MSAQKLTGLKPEAVFGYFEQICSIPHGSGNTKLISDYFVSFAKEKGLRFVQDEWNNVIIFVPGTKGYEDHESVIIQGHMDMVCEKDADCPIDMETEGLDVTHDGEWVFANGTTLGGDDGIAIAYAMAIAADKSIPHPPIEVVITVDEETGMYGALGIDMSVLKGKRLINIDSEEEGIFTVSCAGGARASIAMEAPRHAVYGPCIRLTVDGLAGGHSGIEIHKNLANANKVMGEFLSEIKKRMPLCMTALTGGSKENAIPRSCTVSLVAMGMDLEPINEIAAKLQEKIRTQFDEPSAVVTADNIDALGGNALSTQDTDRIIGLLCAVPNGIQAMSNHIPGLVQTSLNLGVAKLEGDKFTMTSAVRSSVNQEKLELLGKLRDLAAMYECQFDERGHYPAWEYKADSPLRDLMVQTYREVYGKEPQVIAIHAGLECGLLGEKLPGLDSVSIGPDMQDVHTSRERLNIASVERVYNYLLELLKRM